MTSDTERWTAGSATETGTFTVRSVLAAVGAVVSTMKLLGVNVRLAVACGVILVVADLLCFIMLLFAATKGYVPMP